MGDTSILTVLLWVRKRLIKTNDVFHFDRKSCKNQKVNVSIFEITS